MSRKKILTTPITESSGLKLEINDYVNLPIGITPLNFAYTQDFSISVKFKSNSLTQQCICINQDTSVGDSFFYYLILNTLQSGDIGLIWNNGKYQALFSATSYSSLFLNEITHFIITKPANGVFGNIYINGNPIITSIVDLGISPISTNSTNNAIGAINNGSDNFFNGNLHNLQFFDKILTQTEVTELYNTECSIIPLTAQANIVANYEFKESQEFIVNDNSTNSLNGIIVNKSITDVTIGANNSWLYSNGQPYDNSRLSIIPKLIEYNLGEGLKFNGVNNYLQLPTGNTLLNFPYTQDFSISATVTLNSLTSTQELFINKANIGDVRFVDFRIDNLGKVVIIYQNQFAKALITDNSYTSLLLSGIPVHITVTRPANGGLGSIYINGSLVPSTLFDFGAWATNTISDNCSIGFNGLTSNFFNGVIYDLKVFDKELNQSEVQEDFDSNGNNILSSATANLVVWYPIREQEGFIVKDQSLNGLDGTAINYSLVDMTIGINNKRVDKYGNPITQY